MTRGVGARVGSATCCPSARDSLLHLLHLLAILSSGNEIISKFKTNFTLSNVQLYNLSESWIHMYKRIKNIPARSTY